MTARRGWRSAAAAAERDLKRTRCHANEAAGSGRSTSGAQGQDQIGPVKIAELSSMPPPVPIPAIISGWTGDSCKFLTSSRCRNKESKADQEWQEKNPWL